MYGLGILWAQFLAALLLAVGTWFAVMYYLYWRIWWLDIPMHMLGGAWAGLCAAWILKRRGLDFSLLWCLVFALIVGVGWEIFEYTEGIAMPQYISYPLDTAKDVVMDLIGAALAYFFVRNFLE